MWTVEVKFHAFQISALDGDEWSNPEYPIHRQSF